MNTPTPTPNPTESNAAAHETLFSAITGRPGRARASATTSASGTTAAPRTVQATPGEDPTENDQLGSRVATSDSAAALPPASASTTRPGRTPTSTTAPNLGSAAKMSAVMHDSATSKSGPAAGSGTATISAGGGNAVAADFAFYRPADLAEAVRLLAEHPEAVPVAGGTDLMVAVNYRLARPQSMLDLTGLAELREWSDEGDAIRIGSGVPYARIVAELATVLPGLAAASRTVGSPQIRNRGTLGGNLATASPAGDGHPPLLATGATIEIASATSLGDFADAAGHETSPIGGRKIPATSSAVGSADPTTSSTSAHANSGGSPARTIEQPSSSPSSVPASSGDSPARGSEGTASSPFGGSTISGGSSGGGPASHSAPLTGDPAGFASVRTRTVPIAEFFTGPKRSVLRPGELITAVTVPKAAGPQQFLKVGTRNAMVIAVCSLAVALDLDTRRLGTGIGSAGPTPLTAPDADRIELPWTRPGLFNDALAEEFGRRVAAAARPIDDVRGTADYRRHALAVCAARALRRVWTAAHPERTT